LAQIRYFEIDQIQVCGLSDELRFGFPIGTGTAQFRRRMLMLGLAMSRLPATSHWHMLRTAEESCGLHLMTLKNWVNFSAALIANVTMIGCAGSAARVSAGKPERTSTAFTKTADVVYTPGNWPSALKADLYQPAGENLRPAVLLVYGGSWSSSDHRWQMTLLARKLARRGFFVMNATYRGTPDFRYPAPVDDLREALRWMRVHAKQYHLNPDKIAVYGFSAGGYLAAMLGTRDGPPEVRVQAVVAASAPTDLALYPTGDILPRFLGATFAENPALYREASPVTYVTADDPPFFLYHGTDDTTVSPDHSKTFKAALDRAGVRNELRWGEGRSHATTLIFGGSDEDAAINFLDDVLR